LAASLPINLEIAIAFIGVVLPLPARKSLFGCDVDAAKDCGAGGNSLGGCIAGVSLLSGVFQVALVKPANAKNRLISPGGWIFSLSPK
jgi:hypothetical protein